MGLDRELIVGDIDEELMCKICKTLVLDPVCNSNCQHVFCRSCVEKRLESNVNKQCPVCMSKLTFDLVSPSSTFLLKLLDVTVQCSHKCGAVCKIEALPDHITDKCPNTPTPCPNYKVSKPGCKMQVKRCELEQHMQECDYREVSCEACGYKTEFQNLFTHQSRKRCLEKKLRQHIIKESKNTEHEVRRHRDSVKKQHNKIDLEQRKRILQKALKQQEHEILRRSKSISSDRLNFLADQKPSKYPVEICERHNMFEKDTNVVTEECSADRTWATSKEGGTIKGKNKFLKCDKCGQKYREDANAESSCQWHNGIAQSIFDENTCLPGDT